MTVSQAASKWNISERRVRFLCANGQIPGVSRFKKSWFIPDSALKPADSRVKNVTELLSQIEDKKRMLSCRRPLTAGELERLNEEFAVEYTYDSDAIEGNTLTLRETELVLRGLTIDKKPLKDHLEAVGHRDAFAYICDLVREKAVLTENLIKQIHSLVLSDKPLDRGVYRRIPINISGAKFEPVQPYLIPVKMEALLKDYRSDDRSIVERLALFHLRFESIHPFINGNGRTGRLLVNFEFMKAGYPPINIKYIDRKRYYDAFDIFHEKNDVSGMVKLFAKYVNARLDDYLRILE